MILFGIINFTYTWYDPKGEIGPQEFADMAHRAVTLGQQRRRDPPAMITA